jgi:hypothetical protein
MRDLTGIEGHAEERDRAGRIPVTTDSTDARQTLDSNNGGEGSQLGPRTLQAAPPGHLGVEL